MNATKTMSDITPETKIRALLDSFPHLENFLIEMSPAFAKLRNPILRKTVAKVATIRQVAQIGSIPLGTMINSLRAAAGLEVKTIAATEATESVGEPDWVKSLKIVKTLDARPMLEAGEHPIGVVMKELGALKSGEGFLLFTPFLPAPLIDMARGKGYESYTRVESAELFNIYFRIRE